MVVMPTVGPVYMAEVVFSFVIPFVLVTHLVCPSWHLGAPLRGPWVSPWSKPHASTDIKKKKKTEVCDSGKRQQEERIELG